MSMPGSQAERNFAPLSARRLLLLGGIGLILVGMIFGDIFAVFVLHQNAARVGQSLSDAAHAAVAGDATRVMRSFQDVGAFLENRGTKVDTHVHMIDFGYLALMLAILQPWIGLTERTRRALAKVFLVGAALLPVGVFLIHYVGLAYSPLKAIGWASIFADFGGFLVLACTAIYLAGLCKRNDRPENLTARNDALLSDRSAAGRVLLAGGLALILVGFAHGTYYAATSLYEHEARDYRILSRMTAGAASRDVPAVESSLQQYGQLQGEKAVNIAGHAHFVEFGLLAVMLAFFQPYLGLTTRWKMRWARMLLLGSFLLPGCVLLELKYGLLAGGLADIGGFLVVLALLAMWIGILRYTGELDAQTGERTGEEAGI